MHYYSPLHLQAIQAKNWYRPEEWKMKEAVVIFVYMMIAAVTHNLVYVSGSGMVLFSWII
jgi:hypothetical protein